MEQEQDTSPPPPSALIIPLSSYPPPKCFLLACNPKKSTNLGPILRCASAFGVHQIVLVGYAKCSTNGAHGADKHVDITSFPTMGQAVHYLKISSHCQEVIGILNGFPQYDYCTNGVTTTTCQEDNDDARMLPVYQDTARKCLLPIKSSSVSAIDGVVVIDPMARLSCPVHERKFSLEKNTCFFFPLSARNGMLIEQGKYCDSFVHIPHYFISQAEEASTNILSYPLINVETCVSIVLHHFASFVAYDERTFQGHKFEVNKRRGGRSALLSSSCMNDDEVEVEERAFALLASECRRERKYASDQETEQTLEDVGGLFQSVLTQISLDGDY